MKLPLISFWMACLFCGFGCDNANTISVKDDSVAEVTFYVWESYYEREFYQRVLSAFEREHPEIRVRKITSGTGDYWTKLQAMMASGAPPDVFIVNNDPASGLARYASSGVLLDLTGLVRRDKVDLSDFFQQGLDTYRQGGRLFALPISASNLALYFNKDMFDAAGLAYPEESWDWAEFLYAARELTVRDSRGRVAQYGCAMSGPRQWVYLFQNEGEITSADGRRWLLTDSEYLDRNAAGLQFYCDLWLKHGVAPKPISAANLGMSASYSFMGGQVAMDVSGPWEFMSLQDVNFRWGVAELPSGRRRATVMSSMAYAVSRSSNHSDAAWELVKFLTSAEVQRWLAESGRDMPSRKSVANSQAFAVGRTRFGEVSRLPFVRQMEFVCGAFPPQLEWESLLRDSFRGKFDTVVIGKATARQCLEELAREIKARDGGQSP
jgi:multiple sugar transport system substrate-binding protein